MIIRIGPGLSVTTNQRVRSVAAAQDNMLEYNGSHDGAHDPRRTAQPAGQPRGLSGHGRHCRCRPRGGIVPIIGSVAQFDHFGQFRQGGRFPKQVLVRQRPHVVPVFDHAFELRYRQAVHHTDHGNSLVNGRRRDGCHSRQVNKEPLNNFFLGQAANFLGRQPIAACGSLREHGTITCGPFNFQWWIG
jgi:hypothetical protein